MCLEQGRFEAVDILEVDYLGCINDFVITTNGKIPINAR